MKPKNSFKMYWEAYGGYHAFWASYYCLISLVITLLCAHTWLNNEKWVDIPLSTLPSLLGFTLAGYSIWLSVGNEKLKILLAKKKSEEEYSSFMKINASFIHFIILQILALICAIILKFNSVSFIIYRSEIYISFYLDFYLLIDYITYSFKAISFFIYIYSIMTMLAAVLGIFRIAYWTDQLYGKVETQLKCPDCYSDIPIQAKKCSFCGCEIIPINDPSKPT